MHAGIYIIIDSKTPEKSTYISFKNIKVLAMIYALDVKMSRLKS